MASRGEREALRLARLVRPSAGIRRVSPLPGMKVGSAGAWEDLEEGTGSEG